MWRASVAKVPAGDEGERCSTSPNRESRTAACDDRFAGDVDGRRRLAAAAVGHSKTREPARARARSGSTRKGQAEGAGSRNRPAEPSGGAGRSGPDGASQAGGHGRQGTGKPVPAFDDPRCSRSGRCCHRVECGEPGGSSACLEALGRSAGKGIGRNAPEGVASRRTGGYCCPPDDGPSVAAAPGEGWLIGSPKGVDRRDRLR